MAHIFASFHVTSPQSNYDVICGQDLLWELGINLDFENNIIGWKETKIPMISINCKIRTNFAIQKSKNIRSATNRIKKILHVKHKKTNLTEIKTKLKYSNKEEQFLVYRLLQKHENKFDGTL